MEIKSIFATAFCFIFHQKKSAANAYRIICEIYDEKCDVWCYSLECMRIDLNDLKTDFDISDKMPQISCNRRGWIASIA